MQNDEISYLDNIKTKTYSKLSHFPIIKRCVQQSHTHHNDIIITWSDNKKKLTKNKTEKNIKKKQITLHNIKTFSRKYQQTYNNIKLLINYKCVSTTTTTTTTLRVFFHSLPFLIILFLIFIFYLVFIIIIIIINWW